MTTVMIEGFDLYSTTVNATSKGWTSDPNTYVAGRFGGQAFRFNTIGSLSTSFPLAASSTRSIGHAFRVSSFGISGTGAMVSFGSLLNSNVQVLLALTDAGAIEVYRGNFSSLLGTTAIGTIGINTWYYLEVELVVAGGTSGSVKLYLNGTLILSITGVNTNGFVTNTTTDFVTFFSQSGGTTAMNYDLDDVYATDTSTRLGECRVETLRPSADASVAWTPNSGANNFSRVSDTTYDGDTTYVSSATATTQDFYDLTDLSLTPISILAVQTTMAIRKDDATSRTARVNLKSGATTANGTTITVGGSYNVKVGSIYETDPNTGIAWTTSGVNAAQVGPEVVS